MNIKEKAQELFDKLPDKHRQKTVMIGSLALVVIVLWVGVQLSGNKPAPKVNPKSQTESIQLDEGLMKDTLSEHVLAETGDLEEKIDRQNKTIDDLKGELRNALGVIEGLSSEVREVRSREKEVPVPSIAPSNELMEMTVGGSSAKYPPPPRQAPMTDMSGSNSGDTPDDVEVIQVKMIGSIAGKKPAIQPKEEKKNTDKAIYLPVGFMEATLLTGVDAMVGNDAQNNPEPVLVRVQAPAVLPNHVRANLAGCFVIGNAIGILAKERVEVRAVSLSCIDYEKRTVISENIKGFFVDADGKKGLSGRVVTRNGALVGRSFAFGLFDGFGRVAETSAGTQSVSPLGSTTVFDAKDAAVAGIGGGLSGASDSLKDFYLDLAKQVTPVIEVGTEKKVVLVIQEGVKLNIREVNDVTGN